MGMSTRLEMYAMPDVGKFEKMVKALDALKEAGVKTLPQDMAAYFQVDSDMNPKDVNTGTPDNPVELVIEVSSPDGGLCTEKLPLGTYNVDEGGCHGWVVYLDDIPEKVKIIKFYNSF